MAIDDEDLTPGGGEASREVIASVLHGVKDLKIVSLSVEAKEYFLTCSTRNIVTLAHQNPQKSK
jgi:hypothetical protein